MDTRTESLTSQINHRISLFPVKDIDATLSFLTSTTTENKAKKMFLDKALTREKGNQFLSAILDKARQQLTDANNHPTQYVKSRSVNRIVMGSQPNPLVAPLTWLIEQIEARLTLAKSIEPLTPILQSLGPTSRI